MKLLLFPIVALFAISADVVATRAQTKARAMAIAPVSCAARSIGETEDQTIAADANVTISMCIGSGTVVVRGWERKEVRAHSGDEERIALRRADATGAANPAARVEVLVGDAENENLRSGDCGGNGMIELNVPRGSYVQIKGRSGDVNVEDVAGVRVETVSGDVELRHIAKQAEVTSANGDITIRNSNGRVHLRTISGTVEAIDVATAEAGDDFWAKSVTGDVTLEQIKHAHVEAATTSGSMNLSGALARGGFYDFKTTTGDITLELPSDSSFQVAAKVYQGGEIVTDFPIRCTYGPSALNQLASGRLNGIAGKGEKGDATLNLSSFSGTVHLRKK